MGPHVPKARLPTRRDSRQGRRGANHIQETKAMNKNSNGEGSIRSKPRADGRWEARYTAQVDGEWKRRAVFGRTKAEVAQQLRAALAARDAGNAPVSAGKLTLGGFLEDWIAG